MPPTTPGSDRSTNSAPPGVGGELPERSDFRPVAEFSTSIVLPAEIHDQTGFKEWFLKEVPRLKETVNKTFVAGLDRIPTLSAEQRDNLIGATHIAADELLVNIVCYGLGGITAEQRVAMFMGGEGGPELDDGIRARLADPEVRGRVAAVSLQVFKDRAELTVHDGTTFPDFKERWARAPEAALDENLLRPSGRGFLLMQAYGFTAEQVPSGAVTYTLRW